jgi:hypothetical protein
VLKALIAPRVGATAPGVTGTIDFDTSRAAGARKSTMYSPMTNCPAEADAEPAPLERLP